MTAVANSVLINQDVKPVQGGTHSFIGSKQAWLYALEKTIANTALAETQVFAASNKKIDLGPEQNSSYFIVSERNFYRQPNDLLSLHASSQTKPSTLQAAAINPPVEIYSAIKKTSTTGLMVGHLITTDGDTKTLFSSRQPSLTAYVMDSPRYAKQNVVMLHSSAGAEVWIRDIHTPRYKLMEMIKDIRHTMAELGAGLVKVVLNGKEVVRQENLKG